jgi:hypothetical protein
MDSKYARDRAYVYLVTYGDALYDPNAPRVPQTRRQRLADWWEWSVLERIRKARWRIAEWLRALADRMA